MTDHLSHYTFNAKGDAVEQDLFLSPAELADEFGVDDLDDIADDLYTDYLDYMTHEGN